MKCTTSVNLIESPSKADQEAVLTRKFQRNVVKYGQLSFKISFSGACGYVNIISTFIDLINYIINKFIQLLSILLNYVFHSGITEKF